MFFRNNRGFTLVEVMVAVALISGVVIIASLVMSNMTNLRIKGDVQQDLSQLRAEIQMIFSSQQHCNANFKGKPLGTNLPIAAVNGVFRCDNPAADCLTSGNPELKIPSSNQHWDREILKLETAFAFQIFLTHR